MRRNLAPPSRSWDRGRCRGDREGALDYLGLYVKLQARRLQRHGRILEPRRIFVCRVEDFYSVQDRHGQGEVQGELYDWFA